MKGFTLVELVIAIAVAGVVISGVVVTSAELVKNSADPMLAVQRVHIAQSYLDEIEAQAFDLIGANCGAPASGNREDYTHICQYGLISGAAVTDLSGVVPPGLESYTVSVSVSTDVTGTSNLGPASARTANADTALVTVLVASPDGRTTTLSGYFVNGN